MVIRHNSLTRGSCFTMMFDNIDGYSKIIIKFASK